MAGRRSRGNQHTVAVQNQRSKDQREAWKERIQVGVILESLEREAVNPKSQNRIKAAEVLLDRLVPRLSAVEQKDVNELDSLSREELLSRISLLLASDPSLLPELVAQSARNAAVIPAPTIVTAKSA